MWTPKTIVQHTESRQVSFHVSKRIKTTLLMIGQHNLRKTTELGQEMRPKGGKSFVKVRKNIKLFPLHGRVRVRIFDWEITMGSVQGTARRQSKPGFSSRFSQNLRISPFSFLSSRLVVYFIVHHRVREFLQRHLTAFVT